MPSEPLKPMDPNKPKEQQGLFAKYRVERTDGSFEPGQRHEGCFCFVLDIDHDPHARRALEAYALSCARQYPELSRDLYRELDKRISA